MKRIAVLLIVLFLPFSALAEQRDSAVVIGSSEQEMAEQLEQEYGIRILYGEEVTEILADKHPVQPVAKSSVQDGIGAKQRIDDFISYCRTTPLVYAYKMVLIEAFMELANTTGTVCMPESWTGS